MTQIYSNPPDLVIVDNWLSGPVSGIELIRRIKKTNPNILFLLNSIHYEYLYAEIALRAGANGYIMKTELIGKLLKALRVILTGGLFFNDKIIKKKTQKLLYNYDNLK
jgi:DNA-binding NarL/FixJ family response regulator